MKRYALNTEFCGRTFIMPRMTMDGSEQRLPPNLPSEPGVEYIFPRDMYSLKLRATGGPVTLRFTPVATGGANNYVTIEDGESLTIDTDGGMGGTAVYVNGAAGAYLEVMGVGTT